MYKGRVKKYKIIWDKFFVGSMFTLRLTTPPITTPL